MEKSMNTAAIIIIVALAIVGLAVYLGNVMRRSRERQEYDVQVNLAKRDVIQDLQKQRDDLHTRWSKEKLNAGVLEAERDLARKQRTDGLKELDAWLCQEHEAPNRVQVMFKIAELIEKYSKL